VETLEPQQLDVAAAIDQLGSLTSRFESAAATADLRALADDVRLNLHTVVFVGEFNRGKSTLVNALLGVPILPMDVTPTTATINVIRSGSPTRVRLHRRNQQTQDVALEPDSLRRFIGPEFKDDGLQYVEIVVPDRSLADGIVLVDTPGVDDMNQQRVDVTTRYIPRADAVVFVLSCVSALTRSEVDFLTSAILKSGIKRILFVANFAEMIDAEERDTFRATLSNKVRHVLPGHSGDVCLVSARQALMAVQTGDTEAAEVAGLSEFKNRLFELREERAQIKAERIASRIAAITNEFETAVRTAHGAASSSADELAHQIRALDEAAAEKTVRKQRMQLWCRERENELRKMTRKSLAGFTDGLLEEVRDQLAAYNGPDLNNIIEHQVTKLVRTRFRNWIDAHGRQIDGFLQRISEKCAVSIARLFEQRVWRLGHRSLDLSQIVDVRPAFASIEQKGASLHAGLLGGGIMGALTLAGAPFFGPMIGLAAVPVLRDKLHKHYLDEAKAAALPIIQTGLEKAVTSFEENLNAQLQQEVRWILTKAEEWFEQFVLGYRRELQRTMEARQGDKAQLDQRASELASLLEEIEKFKASTQITLQQGANA
jgi:hypothetical protein